MDVTELTGTAETSSRILGLHFQRRKFICRFDAVFITLFVCWFVVYRKAAVHQTVCSSRLYTTWLVQSCLLHVSPSIMVIFRAGFISIPKPKHFLPDCHCGGSGSIPGQYNWDLWWIRCHWYGFYQSTSVSTNAAHSFSHILMTLLRASVRLCRTYTVTLQCCLSEGCMQLPELRS